MAEGWTRALKGRLFEVYSAGIETHGLNPYAVEVMREAGVDISGQKSENVYDLMKSGPDFDYVITLCGHADENCPVFPGSTRVIHIGFDDPPKLAEKAESEEQRLSCYRRVRDEIRDFAASLPESLG